MSVYGSGAITQMCVTFRTVMDRCGCGSACSIPWRSAAFRGWCSHLQKLLIHLSLFDHYCL